MRPDHVPTMAGEDNSTPGYHTKGRLFAVGYMRGLLEAADAGAGADASG
jgi:mannonate dehydratase